MRKPRFRVHSVKVRMVLMFTLLLTGALGVAQTSSFYLFNQEIEQGLMVAVKSSLRVGLGHIDSQFADAESFAVSLMATDEAQQVLTNPASKESFAYDVMLRRLEEMVSRFATSRLSIKRVYFINEAGEIVDSRLNMIPSAVSDALSAEYPEGGVAVISGIHREIYDGVRVEVFSVIRRVFRATRTTNPAGVVVVELDAGGIKKSLDSFDLPAEGHVLLLDKSGELVYENFGASPAGMDADKIAGRIPEEVGDSVINVDGVRYACLSETSDATGWRLVSVIPQKQLFQAVERNRSFTLGLMLICVAVAVAGSLAIVNQVSKPIALLLASMKDVEAGRFDGQVRYGGVEEMERLVDGYNGMTAKIGDLMKAVKREEEEKRRAELYALQAQISPHFLYNTLSSIRYLAWEHNVPVIARVAASLINLSRVSLDTDRFVTLGQELELVEDYMEIARVRYGDVARYGAALPPELSDCLIPRFSVQPLVENALFHGVLPKEGGEIRVEVAPDGEDLRVRVTDTGVGVAPEQLERLRGALAGAESGVTRSDYRRLKSIGLQNINDRIRLYFPGRYGLSIDAGADGGFSATVLIPIKRSRAEEGINA